MSRNRRPPFARLLVLLALTLAGAAWWWFARDDGERLRPPRVDASVESGNATAVEPPPAIAPIVSDRALDAPTESANPPGTSRATLIGRVMQSNGEPVGGGVCVLALRPSELSELLQVERLRDGADEERRAFTDGDGRFRFPAFRDGSLYHVMAGGRGFVSRSNGDEWSPGSDDELVVLVDSVYGLELRLMQQGGAPLPGRCDFGPEPLRPDAKSFEEVLRDDLRAVVAGIRVDQLAVDRGRRLLLHVQHEPAGDSIGPFNWRFDEAGFLPRLETFALPRMGDRLATLTFELALVPGIRFGRLDVRLRGWPDGFEPPAPDARLGRLTFRPSREFGSDWILDLRGRDLEGRRVEGVPQGRWNWTFHAASQCYALYTMKGDAPLVAEVGGGSSELVIDLRETGHLRLSLVPSTRPAVATPRRAILIRSRSSGHRASHDVVDGRLELPFLRPGPYAATALPIGTATDDASPPRSVEFTITAGAVTKAELVVDE